MELQRQEVVKQAHRHILPALPQNVLGVAPTHSCRLPGGPTDVPWVPQPLWRQWADQEPGSLLS